MNTKQIDSVLELAQTLNFNRAAEKLCMSQPSLSYEIKAFENEIGFKIFERSGKGAVLTAAGSQFCGTLRLIREQLKNAIEQGQNFSAKFSDRIVIGLPIRALLPFLPDVMAEMMQKFPDISIVPQFNGFYAPDAFLLNQQDIFVAMDFEVKHMPDVKVFPLYQCGISLLVRKDDILAQKNIIQAEDLYGRTLLVGGASPPALQRVQQRLIRSGKIQYFNSPNHDTTLINVAAGQAVCLSPDFFNDKEDGFTRIPFACPENFKIVLCSHINDKRPHLLAFIKLLQKYAANK